MSDTDLAPAPTDTGADLPTRKTLALSLRLLARDLGDSEFDIAQASAVLRVGRNGMCAKLAALCKHGGIEKTARGRYRVNTAIDIGALADAIDAADGRRNSWTDERRAKASATRKARAAA